MFETSAVTQQLYHLLRGVNDEIAYERIEQDAGHPLAEIRGALSSARRALERDEKIVFATVKGVGLRRLTDGEKVRSTEKIKATIRRASKRGVKRLDTVTEFGKMSNADQLSATINRTIFEAVRDHTTPAATARQAAAPPALPDLSRIGAA
jgi:hypothetical protein